MDSGYVAYVQSRDGEWRVWISSVLWTQEAPFRIYTPIFKTEGEAAAFARGWQQGRKDIERVELLPPYISPPPLSQ